MGTKPKLETFYNNLLGIEKPWQVSKVEMEKEGKQIKIHLNHKTNSLFACKKCGNLCSVYDHQKERMWRHLDTCDYETYVVANLPRTSCSCGIYTITPTWSREQSRFTLMFESHIIDVLQQTQVISRSALLLNLSESKVRTVRNNAVIRGIKNRQIQGDYKLVHLCIDEKSLHQGHHYVSILYDGKTGAVLEVVEHRTEKAVLSAFEELNYSVDLEQVEVITMDMWSAFKTAAQRSLPNAEIVHDRFHLAQYLNKAVDITRRAENKKLRKQENEILKGTRYLWLKNEVNLTPLQKILRDEILENNQITENLDLQTIQVWKLKEDFKLFFDSTTETEANDFFKKWELKVLDLKNQPLIKVLNTFKRHLEHLTTYCKYKVSNAMAESINTSIQLLKAKAKGFYSAENFRINILFHFGKFDLYPQ